MARLAAHLSYANVTATVAVFLALGGGAYAAIQLPKNSVKAKQIARNAVRSAEVKNRSLLPADFKAGTLPAGERGPQGLQGPLGEKGERGDKGDIGLAGIARAYALVQGDNCALLAACPIPKTKAVQYAIRVANGIFCVGVNGIDASAADSVAVVSWAEEGFGGMAAWRTPNSQCAASEFEVLTGFGGSADSADFSIVIP